MGIGEWKAEAEFQHQYRRGSRIIQELEFGEARKTERELWGHQSESSTVWVSKNELSLEFHSVLGKVSVLRLGYEAFRGTRDLEAPSLGY